MISYASASGWYVVYTAARAERRAAKGMKALCREIYLPAEKIWRDQERVERPLFPRYVFINLDPHQDEWSPLLDVDGVQDILRNNQIPSRVPTARIEALQKAESYGVFDRTTRVPTAFEIGEMVKISEGPFAGLNAQIHEFVMKIKKARASKRVKVLLEFLGGQTSVELPVEVLEKV